MKILAFDTCLDKMYVALAQDEEILSSKIVETTKEHYHSAFLISTIRDMLSAQKISPFDIDVIATNIGPGSFTGIRACTTVARVMGSKCGIDAKVIGISSLEILSRLNPTDKKTLVVLDARKDMAYVAVFGSKVHILEPQAMLIDDLKELMKKEDYFIITDDKLEHVLGGVSYQKSNIDLGKFMIEIANDKIKIETDFDWNKLHPLYIQPPPVTVKKQ